MSKPTETPCPSCKGHGRVDCLCHCDADECDCDGTATCYRCGARGAILVWPERLDLTPADARSMERAGAALGLALLRADARRCDLFDAIRAHPCERVAASPKMNRCPKEPGARDYPADWCAECRAVDPTWKAYRIAKGTARKAKSRLLMLVVSLAWKQFDREAALCEPTTAGRVQP